MHVMVTGANGFVGRHTVAELLARGHRVTAVVRPSRTLAPELQREGVEVVHADLRCDATQLAGSLHGCHAVVHLAAGMRGSARARFGETVLATETLLDLMRDLDWRGRLVHVSSLAVYGFNQLPRGATVDESAPLEPCLGRRDDYAWTKAWQERVVRERSPAEVVIVRPGAIYGAGRAFQQRLGRRLSPRAILLIGGRNEIPLSYVENTASLLVRCAEHPRAAGETFNAIDPEPTRQWRYLAALLRAERRTLVHASESSSGSPGARSAPDGRRRPPACHRHAGGTPSAVSHGRASGRTSSNFRPRVLVVPMPLAVFRGLGAGYELLRRLTAGRVRAPGIVEPYATRANFGSYRFDGSKAMRLLDWRPPVSRARGFELTFEGRSSDG